METTELVEARKKAEEAVADMPEGELKVKAFEMILGRLLSSAANVDTPAARRHRRPQNRKGAFGSKADAGTQNETAPARILELKREGFFADQRGIGEIREELQNHGWRYELTMLSGTLMKMVQNKDLRRTKVKDGKKSVYKYFNP